MERETPHSLDRSALLVLFDYTSFTWQSYAAPVLSLGADTFVRPVTGSGWPSLRDALWHIALGWDGWLRDAAGASDPLDATPESVRSWDDLQEHRLKVRGWMRRLLDEMPDEELDAPVVLNAGTAFEARRSPAEILTHILLHERGHHGDICTLLTALGAAVPMSDFLVYAYFRDRRPET